MYKIIVGKNNLLEKAGAAFNNMFKTGDKPLLMLLSGGSSLALLDFVEADSFSNLVTLAMLDDRYSLDPAVNTYSMLVKMDFYKKAKEKGATFFDSSVRGQETLEEYGSRFDGYIKDWILNHPDGIIEATLGIGPDGHTSGILPSPEDRKRFDKLFSSNELTVGYDNGHKNIYRYRLTSTLTLMRKFEKVLTFMSGEAKRDALKRVVSEKGNLYETPGRIIRELKNVEVYTDIML